MAQPITDASGTIIGYELEHTAQNVDDTVDAITSSAIMHRNIYRGKSLGNAVTAAQWDAISSGTFEGLYIGDYWTINSIQWVIADMDYFYNCGDTIFTKHHLVIVPAGNLYNHVMNDTNTTEGGYVGSKMRTQGLADALSAFESAFGGAHALSHSDYFTNAVTSGAPSAGAWYDSTVDLMAEPMVYGCYHYASMNKGSTEVKKYTVGKQQFALFRLNPRMVNDRQTYWLRDVVSSAYFAYFNGRGIADCAGASNSFGVRPYACIGV